MTNGSKTKKIEYDLKQVESLAAQGLTNQQIADALGICRTTLQYRKRDDEQFEQAIKRGQAKGIATVTNKLFEAVKRGNITAMIFYLKTRGGWKETQITEHSGEIVSKNISLKEEEFKELAREILEEY